MYFLTLLSDFKTVQSGHGFVGRFVGTQDRSLARLKALEVKALTKIGKHHDGGGLYLQIKKGGHRSWIFRYSVVDAQGRRKGREMGLGRLEDVSLAKAREITQQLRKDRQAEIDPIEERRKRRKEERLAKAQLKTFKDCSEAYVKSHRAGWRSAKHADQWLSTFRIYVWPVFGQSAVALVDTELVLQALEPIWAEIPETATRVRGRIEAVLDWAKARKLREGDNPARWRGHLDKLLPAPAKMRRVKHHPALPYVDVPDFMKDLRGQESQAALALELVILTATRTSETTGARWTELSLDEGLWIIPADRIKSGREHRIPLSNRAIEILTTIKSTQEREFGEVCEFVFPGRRRDQPMSNMAMLKLLVRMDRSDITVHGFRSTFRDWVSEATDYSSDVAEMALAHTVGSKVEAAYRRGDLLEKRRCLMVDWAAYCKLKCAVSSAYRAA